LIVILIYYNSPINRNILYSNIFEWIRERFSLKTLSCGTVKVYYRLNHVKSLAFYLLYFSLTLYFLSKNKVTFFFFFTCPHKRGKEGFKLVTSASWGMVSSRLSYPLRTNLIWFGLEIVKIYSNPPDNIIREQKKCWRVHRDFGLPKSFLTVRWRNQKGFYKDKY
jgi:hypothetical protein